MNPGYTLVLQAESLDPAFVAAVAASCNATRAETVGSRCARLDGADHACRDRVAALCEQQQVDFAFVPAGKRFADYRLLVSDMDSTLITIECIDEIADMQGLKEQVSAITERSMRGELDFKASLTERVSLLAGLPVAALETVYRERVQLMPGARELLAACQAHKVKFMLVSGGFTFFTERLKQELGLDFAFANQLEEADGKLTGRVLGDIIDADGKAALLAQVRDSLGLAPEQVLAMGDGANDLKMLAAAGLGIAFHAKPVVRQATDVAISHGGLERVVSLFA